MKITAGGDLDTAFGTKTFNFGASGVDTANAIAVQSDGTIILVGTALIGANTDVTILKLDSLGNELDRATIDIPGFNEEGNGVAVFGGNIYVVGATNDNNDFLVARLNQSLDVQGSVLTPTFGSLDDAFGVAVSSDGETVFVVGTGDSDQDIAIARYDANLGNETLNEINLGGVDVGRGVLIHPQTGRLYIGGFTDVNGDNDIVAVEVDPGTIVGGESEITPVNAFIFASGGSNFAKAIAAAPQGRVVLVGASGSNTVVVRLTPDLDADTTFQPNGVFTTNTGVDGGEGIGGLVDPQGRIVAVGSGSGFAGAIRVTGQIGQPGGLLLGGPTTGVVVKDAVNSTFNGYAPAEAPIDVLGANVVVRTAQADVNGDGVLDDIIGSGPGSDRVRVFSGSDGATLADFPAFGGSTAGVYVAGADFDQDGKAEIIVGAGQNNGTFGARVRVFRGASALINPTSPTLMADFAALADANDGIADETPGTLAIVGANVAVGDVNGDGIPDLVVGATGGGGPRATIWDGINIAGANGGKPALPPLANAFVFEESQRGGVWVTLGDVTGDGLADLIGGGGPTGGPRVRIGDMAQILAAKNFGFFDDTPGVSRSNFFVRNDFETYRAGIRVTARDIDGDNIADLVVGSGDGFPADVGFYLGTRLTTFTSGFQAPDGTIDTGFGGGVLTNGVFVG